MMMGLMCSVFVGGERFDGCVRVSKLVSHIYFPPLSSLHITIFQSPAVFFLKLFNGDDNAVFDDDLETLSQALAQAELSKTIKYTPKQLEEMTTLASVVDMVTQMHPTFIEGCCHLLSIITFLH
jgi:hypothetical protein